MYQLTTRKRTYILAVLVFVSLAGGLRWRAVQKLPIDFDEDNYLQAAQHMAVAMREGRWAKLSQIHHNTEHPQLSKLAYAAAIAPEEPAQRLLNAPVNGPRAKTLPEPHLKRARTLSAVIGTIEVLVLALMNPLAGFFLAIHTYTIKYTSQVMLEALPALTSALTIVAYEKHRTQQRGRRWLWLSAMALGLTASCKYLYCLVGLVILIHWIWTSRQQTRLAWATTFGWMAAWGGVSLLVFYATNPYLWPAPIERLTESVLFHRAFSQSGVVEQAGYPAWQPLVWLSKSVPWHRRVFVLRLDLGISLLALVGLWPLGRQRPLYVLWIVVGLCFLLVWPTKWPQYILTLSFPWCLAAAYGAQVLVGRPIQWLIKKRRPSHASFDAPTVAETVVPNNL